DYVESRFSSVGLRPDLGGLTIVRSGQTPEYARVDGDTLVLADSSLSREEALFHVTRAIGFAKSEQFTEEQVRRWQFALVTASGTRVKAVQNRLSAAVHSMEEVFEGLDLPVTRLIAIHLLNGLISAGVSFENAKNVNLFSWGVTAPLATGNQPFSLTPLLGAYAPSNVRLVFADALAD